MNPVILRAAHHYVGRDLENCYTAHRKASSQYGTSCWEATRTRWECDARHQSRGGSWLLGPNDAVETKTARRAPQSNCRVIGDQSVQQPKESNRDMNLDNQKAGPGRFPDATDTTSTPLDGGQIGKIRLGFKATDFVVYPAHGVGQILSIEEQTVAGVSMEFFVMFFTKSKLTVRVPVRKAANIGMRKLSDLVHSRSCETGSMRNSPQRPRQLVSACSGIRGKNQLWRYLCGSGGRSRSFPTGRIRPEFQRTAVVHVGARPPLRGDSAGGRNLGGTGRQGTRGLVKDWQAQAQRLTIGTRTVLSHLIDSVPLRNGAVCQHSNENSWVSGVLLAGET